MVRTRNWHNMKFPYSPFTDRVCNQFVKQDLVDRSTEREREGGCWHAVMREETETQQIKKTERCCYEKKNKGEETTPSYYTLSNNKSSKDQNFVFQVFPAMCYRGSSLLGNWSTLLVRNRLVFTENRFGSNRVSSAIVSPITVGFWTNSVMG